MISAAERAIAHTKRRNAKVAKIKIAQKQLGMADDAYRAMLERVTGQRSLKDCGEAAVDRVAEEMQRLGFVPKKKKAPRAGGRDVELEKLRALWRQAHDIGATRDGSDRALAAYVHRMARVDDPTWLSSAQMERVIEGLKAWCVRVFPEAIRASWLQLQAKGRMPTLTDEAYVQLIARHKAETGRHAASYECLLSAWYALEQVKKGAD